MVDPALLCKKESIPDECSAWLPETPHKSENASGCTLSWECSVCSGTEFEGPTQRHCAACGGYETYERQGTCQPLVCGGACCAPYVDGDTCYYPEVV
jgi:hypothetical protein